MQANSALVVRCPVCGETSMKISRPKRYHYRLSGLDNVYLNGGVTQWTCRSCGEVLTHVEADQQLMEVLAMGILLKPAMLSGQEMRFLRKACRYSQEELAAKLGITRRAILEREKKPRPGLRAEQELGMRAVLFAGFQARLAEEGSHLDPKHSKMLEDAAYRFLAFADRLQRQTKKRRATLTRDARNKRWRFEDPKLEAA